MKNLAMFLIALAFCLGANAEVQAQVSYVTCYQPVTVYSPPVMYAPHTVYYAPTPAPVVYARHAAYYAPAPTVYQPTARVRTRYRPILGGTVTRVRYGYAPTYRALAPVVVAY